MVIGKLREAEKLRGRIAALEAGIAESMQNELAGLPTRFGFADVNAFAAAVERAIGARDERRRNARGTRPAKGRRRRAKITVAMRADVKRLVREGRPGAEIARALRISLPSVQSIKKALGLVRAWKRRPGRQPR